jgi:hypothetical protein
MKIKKFVLGFIAGVIVTLIMSGVLGGLGGGPDVARYEYMDGPEKTLYKIDIATGDVFWIREGSITKLKEAKK